MPDMCEFFDENIPGEWFEDGATVRADRDEILVVGTLSDGSDVAAFRQQTKAQRIAIAEQAEARFQRKVSWGVRVDGGEHHFTCAAIPTMTRLRFDERALLDTLIEGGVARSRSEALAWCVRTIREHHADWLDEMRAAAAQLEALRRRGPGSDTDT